MIFDSVRAIPPDPGAPQAAGAAAVPHRPRGSGTHRPLGRDAGVPLGRHHARRGLLPDPEARERIRDLWDIPAVYADWRDDRRRIARRHRRQHPVGRRPLSSASRGGRGGGEARDHVLTAKPLAETWEQCLAIVSAAREGGIKLGVDQNTRFAPAFYGCGALVRAGALGPLMSATINYHSALGRQHTNAFDAKHDVAVHGVDILLSWFEGEPDRVFASRSRRVDGIGSVLAATLEFADGANATLLYDFATRHRRQFEFIAVGDEASADGLQDQELPGPSRMLRAMPRRPARVEGSRARAAAGLRVVARVLPCERAGPAPVHRDRPLSVGEPRERAANDADPLRDRSIRRRRPGRPHSGDRDDGVCV